MLATSCSGTANPSRTYATIGASLAGNHPSWSPASSVPAGTSVRAPSGSVEPSGRRVTRVTGRSPLVVGGMAVGLPG
jgi:hypothetical protein